MSHSRRIALSLYHTLILARLRLPLVYGFGRQYVFDYRAAASTRVLVTFYFRLQIPFQVAGFFAVD